MSWPIAFFACFSVLVISVFVFLLVIYLKEYSREEKLLKQFAKERRLEHELGGMPIYVMPVAPPPSKKKSVVSEADSKTKAPVKNKKDVN